MTDQYAVFGNPIEHSKSPLIHSAFAEETQQDIHYDKICVADNNFANAFSRFVSEGGKGGNVTVPFKEDAWKLVDERSDAADMAGAVNTISVTADGHLRGDNTDGTGLVNDILQNLGWSLQNRRILILGAGGAVRGVIGSILRHQPMELVIANRTVSKATNLATLFEHEGFINGCGFNDLHDNEFDLIVNGTSASLAGDLPPIPGSVIGPDTFCYDMMYSQETTVFNQWALDQGANAIADGLGMLVEQAAEAFQIWRGCRPSTKPIINQLR